MAKITRSLEELAAAVRSSRSIAGTLRCLGLRAAGANYGTLKRLVRANGLDVSHWTGQGHRKGSAVPIVPARPLSQVLTRNRPVNTNQLRRRLIREGVLPKACSACGLAQWMGQAIPLELDHRDGDRHNQEIANLRLLCPNCHALTPTYRGRNRKGRAMAKMLAADTSDMMSAEARVAKLVDAGDLQS